MKNRSLFLILFILFFLSCSKRDQYNLIPRYTSSQWEFADTVKRFVTAQKYDDVMPFSEGLAAVKRVDKWGYINQKGDEFIKPHRYQQVGNFIDGYATVSLNGKWGFINKKGKEVIPPDMFDYVSEFSEGLALFQKDNLWGYINKKGKIVVPAQYDLAWDFENGMALVNQNKRLGYINKKGKEIIPVKYDYISSLKNGQALARQYDKWFFINDKGVELKKLDYEGIADVDAIGFYLVYKNGKYGFIDYSGREVILLKYDFIYDYFPNYSIVSKNNLYGIIDKKGKEIIEVKYKSLVEFEKLIVETLKDKVEIGDFDLNTLPSRYFNFTGDMQKNAVKVDERVDTIVFDRDNHAYRCVRVDSQIWMAENLKYQLPGSKCLESKDNTDCESYGRYYQWDATSGCCPEGWRLPTEQDWRILINHLGGEKEAYQKLIEGGESGLNLKLGGFLYDSKSYEKVGEGGYYWTSSADKNGSVTSLWLNGSNQSIKLFKGKKNSFRNVRCIKE